MLDKSNKATTVVSDSNMAALNMAVSMAVSMGPGTAMGAGSQVLQQKPPPYSSQQIQQQVQGCV